MHKWRYMKDRDFSQGRKYIGASDMATLTGLVADYRTPREMWEEFTGRRELQESNDRMRWGHIQETNILAEYVYQKYYFSSGGDKKYAQGVRENFIIARMRKKPAYNEFRMWTECNYPGQSRHVAHADMVDLKPISEIMGVVVDENEPLLIQAKNAGLMSSIRRTDSKKGYDYHDNSADGIPTSVFFQEQWETYTYGINQAIVLPLINGNDWRVYGPVRYHKKTVEHLIAIADNFLHCVDTDIAPDPINWRDVVALNPDFRPGEKVIVDPETESEVRDMLVELGKVDHGLKKLQLKKDDIKNAMGLLIGGGSVLESEDGQKLASVSEISGRKTISFSDVKKYPEVMDMLEERDLIKTGDGYRQLYVKGTPYGKVNAYYLFTSSDDGLTWKGDRRKKYSESDKAAIEKAMVSTGLTYRFEEAGKK